MTIYAYIILTVVFILALIIHYFVNKGKRAVSNRRLILTFLCFSIGITIAGFSGFIDTIESNIWWFFLLQAFFLGLGILLVYFFKRKFFGEFTNRILAEITLLVINSMIGIIGFSFLFDFCNKSELGLSFSSSVIMFCIPYFFTTTFDMLASIPQEIFKVWYLNEDAEEPDFDRIDVHRIYLLELELFKNVNRSDVTNLKLKAPLEMKFGEWFQSIILNYNQRFEVIPFNIVTSIIAAWDGYFIPSLLFLNPRDI